MVRERRLAAVLLVGCFDGEDCAAGEPGSKELQLVLNLSMSGKLVLLSIMVESHRVVEMFARPQFVHSQERSDLAMQENTSSDMCKHSWKPCIAIIAKDT